MVPCVQWELGGGLPLLGWVDVGLKTVADGLSGERVRPPRTIGLDNKGAE